MATKTLLSIEEFERLPDDDMQHELDEGELATMPPPRSLHSKIASNIFGALLAHATAQGHRLTMEAGFLLSRNPPIVRQPDVAMLSREHWEGGVANEYFTRAPELAIEILSPSDAIGKVDRKVEQYLSYGGVLVWVVMPEERRVRVFRADGTSTVRHVGEMMDAPELLPGWSMPVDAIFT